MKQIVQTVFQYCEYLCSGAIVFFLTETITHWFNTYEGGFSFTWVYIALVAIIALLGKVRLQQLIPAMSVYLIMILRIRFFPEMRGSFLISIALVFAVTYALVPACIHIYQLFEKRYSSTVIKILADKKSHFIFSVLLSSFYGVLSIIQHKAFLTTTFDFAIFDQALYMLAFHDIPVSTVRQMPNIFFDHQHFALYLLTPVYWIGRGFHGIVLQFITPFFLITFPTLLLYAAIEECTSTIHSTRKKASAAWVISIGSFLLWIHPFTQSAIRFGFHEKYLMPLAVSATIFFLIYWMKREQWKYAVAAALTTIFWLVIKEDQWLFATVFWLQAIIWITVFNKAWLLTQKKRLFTIIAIIIIAITYGVVLLPAFSKYNGVNDRYSGEYDHAKEVLLAQLEPGNTVSIIEEFQLFQDARPYLMQNAVFFDIPGLVVLPMNVLGNYAERVLAQNQNFVSPSYHYGVDVPIYSLLGIIALWLFLFYKREQPERAQQFLIGIVIVYLLGFSLVLGWNKEHYFFPRTVDIFKQYVQTAEERDAFIDITALIPHTASIVTTTHYLPLLSARENAALWPETPDLTYNSLMEVDRYEYEYWLLPNTGSKDYAGLEIEKQIEILQDHGYSLIEKNEYQILFQR